MYVANIQELAVITFHDLGQNQESDWESEEGVLDSNLLRDLETEQDAMVLAAPHHHHPCLHVLSLPCVCRKTLAKE